ncbi:MAG: DUF1178 family protein [Opitutae bacterium]|nr:DUF1178 family protein [Opitutae bacterium]
MFKLQKTILRWNFHAMIAYDLKCARGHVFEGWFDDEAAFLSQQQQGLIACPVCNDATVARIPSTFAIRAAGVASAGGTPDLEAIGRKISTFIRDNFDNVVQAVRVITDQRGLDVAMRRVTISTCGLDEGIRRLAGLRWPHLRLAVSLNAPNDRLRDILMPINRRVPLKRLMAALDAFPLAKDSALMMAYVLVPGVNDGPEHARQIAALLAPLKARINLIGFNPLSGENGYRAPDEAEIDAFGRHLADAGVFVCRRRTKGQDLAAACGQLRSQRPSAAAR